MAAGPAADASSAEVPEAAVAAVPVAAVAAVPVAAVKAKSHFPLTITLLRSPGRDRGSIGPRGAYPAEASASLVSHALAGFACACTRRDVAREAWCNQKPQCPELVVIAQEGTPTCS